MSPSVVREKVMRNRRLFLTSTIDDVIHTPLTTKSGRPLTLQEYWKILTPAERAKVLAVRKEKTLLQTLLRDTSLNEVEIERRMKVSGYNISRQQIALIRKTHFLNRMGVRKIIMDTAKATKNANEELAKLQRRNNKQTERRKREQVLQSLGVQYFDKIETSSLDLITRYKRILQKYDYAPKEYNPFLSLSSEVLDIHIATLDHYRIDWRSEEGELWRLVGNSPEYIHRQMAILNSVEAQSELHFVLLKKLSTLLELMQKPKQAKLCEAVVGVTKRQKEAYKILLGYCESIARFTLARSGKNKKYLPELIDLTHDTLIEVLHYCKHPENNPAAFMSIVAATINFKINQYFYEKAISREPRIRREKE